MVEKRGLSNVVSIVLILIVVLASVSIIWFAYKKIAGDSDFKIESGLLAVNLQASDFKSYSNGVELKVKRFPGGGKVDGLLFVFSNEEGSKSIKEIKEINELDQRVFSFVLSFSPVRVEAAPIAFNEKGKEVIGKITAKRDVDVLNKSLPLPSSGAGLCIVLRDSLSSGPCEEISCGSSLPVDSSLINRFCELQEDGSYHVQCSVTAGCGICVNKAQVNSCAGIEDDSNRCQNSYELSDGEKYGCMWDNWNGGVCFRSKLKCA